MGYLLRCQQSNSSTCLDDSTDRIREWWTAEQPEDLSGLWRVWALEENLS